jgi:hypothetical protein
MNIRTGTDRSGRWVPVAADYPTTTNMPPPMAMPARRFAAGVFDAKLVCTRSLDKK